MDGENDPLEIPPQGLDPVLLRRLLLRYGDELEAFIAARIPKPLRGVLPTEDVLQEVWTAAFRHLNEFRPAFEGGLLRWLQIIASRKLCDAIRSETSKKRGGLGINIVQGRSFRTTMMAKLGGIFKRTETPSRQMSVEETERAVQVAIASLPEQHAEAVRMTIEGRSRREIARALNKPTSAVNWLVYSGMSTLRRKLSRVFGVSDFDDTPRKD